MHTHRQLRREESEPSGTSEQASSPSPEPTSQTAAQAPSTPSARDSPASGRTGAATTRGGESSRDSGRGERTRGGERGADSGRRQQQRGKKSREESEGVNRLCAIPNCVNIRPLPLHPTLPSPPSPVGCSHGPLSALFSRKCYEPDGITLFGKSISPPPSSRVSTTTHSPTNTLTRALLSSKCGNRQPLSPHVFPCLPSSAQATTLGSRETVRQSPTRRDRR